MLTKAGQKPKGKKNEEDRLPSQFIIGPGSNPSWQLHSKLPTTLEHVPFPQGLPMEHSSVSAHNEQMQSEENWDKLCFKFKSSNSYNCTHLCNAPLWNPSCTPWGTRSGTIHQYWCSDHWSKSLGFQDIHWHLKSRKILRATQLMHFKSQKKHLKNLSRLLCLSWAMHFQKCSFNIFYRSASCHQELWGVNCHML